MTPVTATMPATREALFHDIFEHVRIDATGEIWHRHYPRRPPAPEFVARLRQLPEEMRQRYLTLQLRSFLEEIYFRRSLWQTQNWDNGSSIENTSQAPLTEAGRDHRGLSERSCSATSTESLQNNFYQGLDVAFYESLKRSNCGRGYFDSGWEVRDSCDEVGCDEVVVVTKHGLTLEAMRAWQVAPEHRQAQPGDRIALLLPPNQMGADHYIAIGNAGLPQDSVPDREQHPATASVQCFFNLPATSAPVLVARVTHHLNEQSIPFRLQVLNASVLYDERCDAGVLEIARQDYFDLKPWLEQLAEYLSLDSAILPLTKRLRPGLSVAEVPRQRASDSAGFGAQAVPFGQHRGEAIATAIIAAGWSEINLGAAGLNKTGLGTNKALLLRQLKSAFAQFEIDWEKPYLNQNSGDL